MRTINGLVADVANDLIAARLRAGNLVQFTVPTSSMFPALAPRDRVIVRGARAADLRIGDIIIVQVSAPDGTATTWVAHRLIARRIVNGERYLITKGDNGGVADAPWTESQICGRVVAAQRPGAPRPVDLLSRRAQWAGMLLALISRGQETSARVLDGWLRRLAVKCCRVLLRASALGARKITG